MPHISTHQAAEAMLKSGGYFTAASLGKLLNISAKKATGLLYNIRQGLKYQTIDTDLPNRQVKLLSINGRKTNTSDLWRIALGCRIRKAQSKTP